MNNLISIKSKTKKRIGRGLSSGQGKTAGRGTKGQKSRSGHNIPRRFEGGQTPLSMRLPKLPGFRSVHKKSAVISLDQISKNFKNGDTVSLKSLLEKRLIAKGDKVKVLKNGTLSISIEFAPEIKLSKSIKDITPVTKEKTATPEKSKKNADK